MKRGIIFDLDGTLWDASEITYESFGNFFEENGFKKPSYNVYVSLIGKTKESFAKEFFPGVKEERQKELIEKLFKRKDKYLQIYGAKLYEGMEETLKEISSQYPLFIVSNSDMGYIETFLEYYNFNRYFTGHLSNGDTRKEKYENIKIIINDYELDESFYVGDTELDYLSTLKAGIPFVWASYGFGSVSENVIELKEFKNLPEIINKIFI